MNSKYQNICDEVYKHVIAKIKNGLHSNFTYHSLEHTLDVFKQTQQIAARENISDDESLFLLRLASLYHDTGFLHTYAGHEERGCELAKEELPGFGVSDEQIEKICGMIRATKIPQSPKNKLEEIICDADLDYLGRDDFDLISNNLYKEFTEFGIVKDYDQWMKMQVGFFESHHYFTDSSRAIREPMKQGQLKKIKMHQPSANR
jgi:uncharacterized protein